MIMLTEDEVIQVTGRQRFNAQARELEFMRIPVRRRRDGSCAVLRIHVDMVASLKSDVRPGEPKLVLQQ